MLSDINRTVDLGSFSRINVEPPTMSPISKYIRFLFFTMNMSLFYLSSFVYNPINPMYLNDRSCIK
jgi:predicted membrane channel-forming protein YqfA (hemolysin III family)